MSQLEHFITYAWDTMYKTWTLDSGLDHGLDFGLNNRLDM